MQSSSKPKLIFIPAANFEFHNKLILQLHFESKDLNFKLRSDLLLLNSVQLGLVMDLSKTFNAPMLYTFYLNVSSKLSQAYYILLCFTLKWLFSTILCVLKLDIAPGSTAQVKFPPPFLSHFHVGWRQIIFIRQVLMKNEVPGIEPKISRSTLLTNRLPPRHTKSTWTETAGTWSVDLSFASNDNCPILFI